MNFIFTKEEEQLIDAVKKFIHREATPELIEETHTNEGIYGAKLGREFIQKFAANGWLVPNWPREYGGLGSSEMLMYIIKDLLTYYGLPSFFVGAHYAGPTILRFADDNLKNRFLLPIAKGEIEFCLGYTEPGAGSDLLSLEMRAEDMGNHFLVNGQKTFNTHAHVADYHWVALRTDPTVKKHKGISMMIVDIKSPGITIRPLTTIAGSRTNEVFYDNVKVPKENLVGEINKGYQYIMAALDFERMFPFGHYRKLFQDIVNYAKETKINKIPLSKNPLIRQKLAQMATELEVAKLLYYQLPCMLDKKIIPNYQSSMEKTFVSEMSQRLANMGMQILGCYGQLKRGSKWAPIADKVEYYYRWTIVETIYGGTSEIQRNIMATRGLGLPRA